MPSFEKKWIEVQGYKHDGSLHRIWDSVYCVEEKDNYIVLVSKRTKVIEHNFKMWWTKEPAVMILFKDRWMNVIAMLKKTGLTYYINLASPFVKDQGRVKFIDYDLDYKFFPNNKIKLVDVKEYNQHRKKYNYGEDIDKILKYNSMKLRKVMENREFPFQDDKILEYYDIFLKEVEKKDESNL